MSETSNVAKMAMVLSEELFSEFFWTKVGPADQNWPCEETDVHNVDTHPADVVFYYDEPYSHRRTFVHCDLKSYAKGSIAAGTISAAIRSLAKQVACAEKSDRWRELYMHGNVTPDVCGLLFVYNHDGGYDKDFSSFVHQIDQKGLVLPKGARLFIFGPKEVFWLDNVRYDIRQLRGAAGSSSIPDARNCKYFHPQLEGRANLQPEKARAATLEMLTSPWIVLEYRHGRQNDERGVVVYYRRPGESEEEFMYLLDFLRHYQLLEEASRIQIRSLNCSPTSASVFQKSQQRYIESLGDNSSSTELADRVKSIVYGSMPQIKADFSTVELGMDHA